jgi:hypothetical protein
MYRLRSFLKQVLGSTLLMPITVRNTQLIFRRFKCPRDMDLSPQKKGEVNNVPKSRWYYYPFLSFHGSQTQCSFSLVQGQS